MALNPGLATLRSHCKYRRLDTAQHSVDTAIGMEAKEETDQKADASAQGEEHEKSESSAEGDGYKEYDADEERFMELFDKVHYPMWERNPPPKEEKIKGFRERLAALNVSTE